MKHWPIPKPISRRSILQIASFVGIARAQSTHNATSHLFSYKLAGASTSDLVQYAITRSGKLIYTTLNRQTGAQTIWCCSMDGQPLWFRSTAPNEQWGRLGASAREVFVYTRIRPKNAATINVHAASDGTIIRKITDSLPPSQFLAFLDERVISLRSDKHLYSALLAEPTLGWQSRPADISIDAQSQCGELVSDGSSRVFYVDLCTASGWLYSVTDGQTRNISLSSTRIREASLEIKNFRAQRVAAGFSEERQPRTGLLGGPTLTPDGNIYCCLSPYDPKIGLIVEMFDVNGIHKRTHICRIPAGVLYVPVQLLIDSNRIFAVFPLGDVAVYAA